MRRKIKRMKGKGIGDDINNFLKKSKILSNIGQVLLPVAGGALAGLATINPLGLAAGSAVGTSANEYIKSLGYGKRRMKGKGDIISSNGIIQATQPPTTQKGNGGSQYGVIFSEFGKVKF